MCIYTYNIYIYIYVYTYTYVFFLNGLWGQNWSVPTMRATVQARIENWA